MITKSVNEITQRWHVGAPLVSICCITYNQSAYISEAIDSFLSQETDFPFEIIIGDDASTDETRVILSEYASKFGALIKVVFNEVNVGANANITTVMSQAKGSYIAICEGDDYWHVPRKLQRQVDFLESHSSVSLCCHDYKIREGEKVFENGTRCDFDVLTFEEYAKSMPNIQTLTVVFRNPHRPLIPAHMIRKVTGSVFIFLRLAEMGDIKYIDTPMATYRVHAAGIWSGKTAREKGEMALQNIDAMREYFSSNPRVMGLLTARYVRQSVTFANYSLLRRSWSDCAFFVKKSFAYGFCLGHVKSFIAFYWVLGTKMFKKLLRISR